LADLSGGDFAEEIRHLPVTEQILKKQNWNLWVVEFGNRLQIAWNTSKCLYYLGVLLTIQASVAAHLMKNCLRSTLSQTRLADIARLSIESW